MTSAARSRQGWATPRAYSSPVIWPVWISDAGCPSSGTHHGACGPSATEGSTNAAPPSAGQAHQPQRHLHGGRLAGGRPAVRLERVAEPAVRVPVGGDRVPHRLGRAGAEQPLEHPAGEQPSPRGQEVRRPVKVRILLHEVISAGTVTGVLNETATARSGNQEAVARP